MFTRRLRLKLAFACGTPAWPPTPIAPALVTAPEAAVELPFAFACAYWLTAPTVRRPFGPSSWMPLPRSARAAFSTVTSRGVDCVTGAGWPVLVAAAGCSSNTFARSRPSAVPSRNRPSAVEAAGAAVAGAAASTLPPMPSRAAVSTATPCFALEW